MIEVNRRLYLDERDGSRSLHFESCRTTLKGVLERLIEETQAPGAISPTLWSAYHSTTFRATVDEMDIRIRPGQMEPSLDRALRARGATSWAYITAWDPGSAELPPGENGARHDHLKNEVTGLRFEAFEGYGEPTNPNWMPERSLLVFGISASEAVAMGRRYGQIAIVVGELGQTARLVRVPQL